MNYKLIYDNLCGKSKARGLTREVGYEIHHVIPRCLGGSDNKDNLAKLTYKEHLLAHKLLYKMYPDNSTLKSAYFLMSNVRGRYDGSYHHLKSNWCDITTRMFNDIEYAGFKTFVCLPVKTIPNIFKSCIQLNTLVRCISEEVFKDVKITPCRLKVVKLTLVPIIYALSNDFEALYYPNYCKTRHLKGILNFMVKIGLLTLVESNKRKTYVFTDSIGKYKITPLDINIYKNIPIEGRKIPLPKKLQSIWSINKNFYISNPYKDTVILKPINCYSISEDDILKNLYFKIINIKDLKLIISEL